MLGLYATKFVVRIPVFRHSSPTTTGRGDRDLEALISTSDSRTSIITSQIHYGCCGNVDYSTPPDLLMAINPIALQIAKVKTSDSHGYTDTQRLLPWSDIAGIAV
jgi:hypothetical protein